LADTYADPETDRVQAWLDQLEHRATTTANSDDQPDDAAQFLSNVYSMAIKKLADTYADPETDRVQAWLDQLEHRATTTANSDEHKADAAQFLENVYSMAINNLADTYADPETDRVQAWLDQLEHRATTTANSDEHKADAAQFLSNVYSMAIKKLADTYADPETDRVQAWLDQLEHRATTTANSDDQPDDAAQFLSNVYSMAIKKLADTYADPETDRVQAWLDQLAHRLPTLGKTEASLASSVAFTANVTAMTVAQIQTSQAVEHPDEWSKVTFSHALDAVDQADLDGFSRDYQRVYYISCLQAQVLPEALPVFILELRSRTVESDDPVLTDKNARLDLLASALADAVFGMWTFGDQKLESDPGRYAPQALGAGASDDLTFVVDALARTDERLAHADVSEWLLELADDRPDDPLRDRTLGFGYAAASSTLDDSDDTNQSVELLAEAATFADDRDATTRLYRAGLQAIRDQNRDVAERLLELAWLRRDTHDSETTAHGHAVAAGVGYAAHLALEDDPEPSPESVLAEVESADVELSAPVTALVGVIREDEHEPGVDPDALTEGIDAESEPHNVDDLESLAYASLVSYLLDPPGPAEYYEAALRAMAQSDPETAIQRLHTAWEERDEGDDSTHRDVVAAGVGLLAHVDMGMVDSRAIDREDLAEGVASTRDELSPAVLAAFEHLTGGETAHTPDEFLDDVDENDLGKDELETMIFAKLLDLLVPDTDESGEQPVREESSGSDPQDEPTTDDSSPEDGSEPSVSEIYTAALRAVHDNEAEQAVRAFAFAWEMREDVDDPSEIHAAVTAGIALWAHIEMGWLDPDTVDESDLTTAVARYRENLSDTATALFDACAGRKPEATPDEFRSEVDRDDEEGLEVLVLATLLEHVLDSNQ
ncbi:hypothetical protein, partial [Halorubrum vacuolatum]